MNNSRVLNSLLVLFLKSMKVSSFLEGSSCDTRNLSCETKVELQTVEPLTKDTLK